MTIMVIDGQGGKMGKGLVEQLKKLCPEDEILAIGTNSIATAAMLKSGADAGATGENPAVVTSRTADIIVGPMGIVIADSLMGEITPKMAGRHWPEPSQKSSDPRKPLPALCRGLQGYFYGGVCEACGGGSFEDPPWGNIDFMA